MKLIALNPTWVGAGGDGIYTRDAHGDLVPTVARTGVGVSFDCPCGCDLRCFVPFNNPLDGKGPHELRYSLWQREGDTFETLTLRPSILRSRAKGGCGWHGFITHGEVA